MKKLLLLLFFPFHFACKKDNGTPNGPTEVEYRAINTNASHMYVSYHNEDQRLWGFQDPANWSTKFVLKQKPFTALLRGTIISKENLTGTLTMEILVNGKVVKSETKSGSQAAIVMEYSVP
jgi:hypothetical protein